MTTKADFTAEEWEQLLEAPMSAGMYIATADPSVFGSVKEAYAVAKSITVAGQQTTHSELMAELLAEFKDKESAKQARPERPSAKDPAALRTEFLNSFSAVASLLDAKATAEEATEIKGWLYQVAVDAANASKEGGFLGIGAVRVSDAEKTALQALAEALGIQPSGEDAA